MQIEISKQKHFQKGELIMDYKNMTDSVLATIMVNYINRVKHLKDIIGRYLDRTDNGSIHLDRIKVEYRELKNELRKTADYLWLERNRKGSALYMRAFSPSIREAMAEGFRVPVNAIVNFKMFTSVADAHYKLTKYVSLEEWGELM